MRKCDGSSKLSGTLAWNSAFVGRRVGHHGHRYYPRKMPLRLVLIALILTMETVRMEELVNCCSGPNAVVDCTSGAGADYEGQVEQYAFESYRTLNPLLFVLQV